MKTTHWLLAGALILTATWLRAESVEVFIPATEMELESRTLVPRLIERDATYVLDFPDTATDVRITLPEDKADWKTADQFSLRLYNAEPSKARIIVKVEPEGEYAGGFWWFMIKADWRGWKEVPFLLNGRGFLKATKTEKEGIALPATLGRIRVITLRNQWGTAGTPEISRWGIPQPSPGRWEFAGIRVNIPNP